MADTETRGVRPRVSCRKEPAHAAFSAGSGAGCGSNQSPWFSGVSAGGQGPRSQPGQAPHTRVLSGSKGSAAGVGGGGCRGQTRGSEPRPMGYRPATRRGPAGLAVAALDLLLATYQLAISPLYPASCRFYPSCSSFAREALRVHGLWGGGWRAAARLLRCHPLHPGGFDPVPPRRD